MPEPTDTPVLPTATPTSTPEPTSEVLPTVVVPPTPTSAPVPEVVGPQAGAGSPWSGGGLPAVVLAGMTLAALVVLGTRLVLRGIWGYRRES